MTEIIKIIVDNGLTVGIVIYFMFLNFQFNNKILENLTKITEMQERITASQERIEQKIDAEI